jgi:outer membrane protein OmpA-like peptidoglycan-associated protein
LLSEKDSLGVIPKTCAIKKIRIYDNYQELALKGKREEDKVNEKTDSVTEQNKSLQIRFYYTDDMSERQKVKIREALKESGKLTIKFDKYGIKPASYQFLDSIAGILKENPDIRLELVLNAHEAEIPGNKMEISEEWARELTFYFKNKKIDINALRCKGFDLSNPVFKPFIPDSKTIDGVIEFMFMKN